MCSACAGDYENPEATQEPDTFEDKWPWTEYAGEAQTRWTADASDIESCLDGSQPKCPVCGAHQYRVHTNRFPAVRCELSAQRDGEDEVQCWQGLCKCGVELVIFND